MKWVYKGSVMAYGHDNESINYSIDCPLLFYFDRERDHLHAWCN
jgi:hypothetical protein